jgi:hypothetical protein
MQVLWFGSLNKVLAVILLYYQYLFTRVLCGCFRVPGIGVSL